MNCDICSAEMPEARELVICERCFPIAERLRQSLALISTGNVEQDQAHHRAAVISSARLELNICPNACGPLKTVSPGVQECPACHFTGYHRQL